MKDNKTIKKLIKSFLDLEEISHEIGLDTLKDIVNILANSNNATKKHIIKWYKRFAVNGVLTTDDVKKVLNKQELKEFKKLMYKYINDCEIYHFEREYLNGLKELKNSKKISRLKTIETILKHNNNITYYLVNNRVNEMIKTVYSNSYYRTIYEIQKHQNILKYVDEIDKNIISNLPYIKWAKDKLGFVDRIDYIGSNHFKMLNEIIIKSVVYERPIEDTLKKVSNIYSKEISKLGRLIRTEQAYYHSIAQKQAYNHEGVEEYQIIAIIDKRTSQICRFLNRKKFNIIEYEIGTTAPPFHPNCRSTTRPCVYRKNYNDLYNISFDEWKKKYVK